MGRFNPNQARDRLGRWKSQGAGKRVAVVPYARASLRSQTVGVNSGANVSKNYRVSLGAYARIERRSSSVVESAIKSRNNAVIEGVARKLSPDPSLEPLVKSGVQAAQRKVVRKYLSGQLPVGKKARARLGTSRVGLPSVSVRLGSSKVSAKKRAAGIERYQKQMEGLKQKKAAAKTPRPQRRKKAA